MVGKTDQGIRRDKNEDFFFYDEDLPIALLADGVGGAKAGEIASKLAVESVYTKIKTNRSKDPLESIVNSFESAQDAIMEYQASHPEAKGMCTTLECLYFSNNMLYLGHTGDSRTYLFHEDSLWQLTVDHNIKTFIERGLCDVDKIKRFKPTALVKVVGFQSWKPDVYTYAVQKGQIFLSASDGLFGMISDDEICELIRTCNDLGELTDSLVSCANKSGGKDNITLVVAQVKE